jgi:thiamine biosynthesis lipoprotein
MGCEVIVAGAGEASANAITALFEARDEAFSRFRPGSELARVNAAATPLVSVSPIFAAAVSAALVAARATDGLVDPTLGAALEAVGYDADFDQLRTDPRPPAPVQRGDWRDIRIGPGLLVRPPGTVLDLNGVVKAMAVDAAVDLLDGPGFVSAGGDIATRGRAVTVALPGGDTVTLGSGAIATSGTATRRWIRGGQVQHHLIDPRTCRPSASRWRYVTAVGRDCLSADTAAKAGFLLDQKGPDWLDKRGVAARFVADNKTVENGCWARSVGRDRAWV